MAPFRGGRGGRGAARGSGKLARSGIRTRSGYRRFDSQRVKEVEEDDAIDVSDEVEEESEENLSDEDEVENVLTAKAYSNLLQSFQQPANQYGKPRKRQKLEPEPDTRTLDHHAQENEDENAGVSIDGIDSAESEPEDATTATIKTLDDDDDDDENDKSDPFETHFANPDENELSRRLKSIQSNEWRTLKHPVPSIGNLNISAPSCVQGDLHRKQTIKEPSNIPLKARLLHGAQEHIPFYSPLEQAIAPYIFNYTDLFFTARTPQNADSFIDLSCLHALNHVLKGRDKVIKNNARLAHATGEDDAADLDFRDQGFTRPKVLILTETRQMCYRYGSTLAQLFNPEQQENKQRFEISFNLPTENDKDSDMPDDYRELFEGNSDNKFVTSIKLTRKTMKFFSSFYTSDILLASPLGLRGILENEDVKKRDYDFLSSIEVVIVDQADAMAMQSWSNVETVFKHLNLPLKEAHGCDFSRVRSWYLDGHAKYLRHTLISSAYTTPEMNRLFNADMQNIAGKAKLLPTYDGQNGSSIAINEASNTLSGVKQTFSRFDCKSPSEEPEARFKYFTTTILPSLLRLPRPAEGGQGILIFIPSYYDFLRLRNYFATSNQTANISFGTISEYSDRASQQRARAHFLSGRHSFLLYTQRAHHFFRLRLRGVRRVVMYGLPDNPIFYEEVVGGFLGTSLQDQRLQHEEAGVRCMFSRYDAMALERVVGTSRLKGMLSGLRDTFEFV
jgi:U3 small nucleolar RNA-associated protein 25